MQIEYPKTLKHEFFPFMQGKYEVGPGLKKLPKGAPVLLWDHDDAYVYHNKLACRKEGMEQYYKTHRLSNNTRRALVAWLATKVKESERCELGAGSHGSKGLQNMGNGDTQLKYLDEVDAYMANINEDVAVWQLTEGSDWMALAHLCAPNHWSPAEKIGRNFDLVHAPIPGMEKLRKRYRPMLQSIAQSTDTYERFAWGLTPNRQLNAHPLHLGRTEGVERGAFKKFFVRVERQTLSGLPSANAFVFTIRTFFYKVGDLPATAKQALQKALQTMSDEQLSYKGIPKEWVEAGFEA